MLEALLAGVFGLVIGSFLNVCIFRWPRDLSVVRPRSFCPQCEKTIAWHDNIPVISYLWLRGSCRHCGFRIPIRYLLVELLTGILFFSFVAALGLGVHAFKFCLLSALLIGMIFADLEERILPDELTLGGAVAGVVLAWWVPVGDGLVRVILSLLDKHLDPRADSVAESVLGAAVPSLFLWLVGFLFEKIRHKEGLGFGDVKMMATLGAFLGLRETLFILIVGSLLGSVLGLAFILLARKESSTYELPFGSFLGVSAIGVCLWGQNVVGWYGRLF
ncbi:MAG: prepilin peptidase [Bryobacteraceae bacterium]